MPKPDFDTAAELLGWQYSADHEGWIHKDRLVPPNFDDHEIAHSTEEACRIMGVGSEAEVDATIREHML